MKLGILLAVFSGGALGSLSRYFIWLGVEQVGVRLLVADLVGTSVVNIAGAGFLGFVHSKSFRSGEKSKAFWGSGFAGGFTTMSGLALITGGLELGLSEVGYLYWLAVVAQCIFGILAYRFARSVFKKTKAR